MSAKTLLKIILFFGCVFFTDFYIRHGTNVLYTHPNWVSAKSLIPNGLVTAQEFVFERQSLAHDKLKLGEWNGFNEVLWTPTQDWKQLSFDLELSDNSYLWIIFSQTPTERMAFRLSRNGQFKSGFFILNKDREFIRRTEFAYDYHEGHRISVTNSGGKIKLQSGSQTLFEENLGVQPLVSFRSGLNKVAIDNLATDQVTEDFSPSIDWSVLLFAIVINLLIFLVLRPPELQITFFILMFGLAGLDYSIWSAGYYEPNFIGIDQQPNTGFTTMMENARKKVLFFFTQDPVKLQVLQKKNFMSTFFIPENAKAQNIYFSNGLEDNSLKVRQKYIDSTGHVELLDSEDQLENKDQNSYKIGFFGSSQTFGGGALSLDQNFASMSIAQLNQQTGKKITGYNFSRPGEESWQLLDAYHEVLKYWKPDLLVVNLAHNDHNIDKYKKNMQKLMELNQQLGIKTLIVLEPNTSELGFNPLKEKHNFLRTLAPDILDLQKILSEPPYFDSGFIWWDLVHFDQAGHNAAAKELTAVIYKIIQN